MKTEPVFPSRQIWLVAMLTAIVIGAPLSFFSDQAPWVIAIPILVGTSIIMLAEFAAMGRKGNQQLPLLKMGKSFWGLAAYRRHVALALPPEDDEPPDQGIFDFVSAKRRNVSKTARLITDAESGDQVYVIDSERFVTLLLNRVLPNTDQVTEVSLLHAIHRYGEMNALSPELERFLTDKTVLEVVKSDFRGNTAQTVNRCGESVVRELVKQAKQMKLKPLTSGAI